MQKHILQAEDRLKHSCVCIGDDVDIDFPKVTEVPPPEINNPPPLIIPLPKTTQILFINQK
jgi:hypothetical protein